MWEVKREDAVAAIRAMLDQAPDPVFAGDSAYVAALAGASQILADEAALPAPTLAKSRSTLL